MGAETDPFEEDAIIRPIFPFLVQTLKKRFRPLGGGTVMDLGGGRGGWLAAFRPEQPDRLVLVDLDRQKVREASLCGRATEEPPVLIGLVGEAAALPLANGCIDAVVSRNSFHLWPDQPRALAEVFRVLTPGGAMLIGRGFGPDLPEPQYLEVKERRRAFRRATGNPGDATPSPEPSVMVGWLRQAGFGGIETIPDRKAYWAFALKPR
jgi:SAM-dependent methyltransferase